MFWMRLAVITACFAIVANLAHSSFEDLFAHANDQSRIEQGAHSGAQDQDSFNTDTQKSSSTHSKSMSAEADCHHHGHQHSLWHNANEFSLAAIERNSPRWPIALDPVSRPLEAPFRPPISVC